MLFFNSNESKRTLPPLAWGRQTKGPRTISDVWESGFFQSGYSTLPGYQRFFSGATRSFDTSWAKGRRHERRSREKNFSRGSLFKTWPKPETGHLSFLPKMLHVARTTQKLYIVVLSWKTDCKKNKLIKNFNKSKLKKSDLKIFPLIEELRGSWFDLKKVTIIRVECYIKQKLCWQDQKSLINVK